MITFVCSVFIYFARARMRRQEKIPVRSVQIEKLLLVVLSTVKQTRVDPSSNPNFQLFRVLLMEISQAA